MAEATDNSSSAPSDGVGGAGGGGSPLEHVVDDLSPREEWADWVVEQLLAGRKPEALVATLREQGWDADEAEALVEDLRKATRPARGVVTRDDVMRQADRQYRQSWSPSWFSGLPTLSSGVRLLGGLRNLFALWRVKGAAHDAPPSEEKVE